MTVILGEASYRVEERLDEVERLLKELKAERRILRASLAFLRKEGPFTEVQCTNAGWVGDRTCGETFFIKDWIPLVESKCWDEAYSERWFFTHDMMCPGCGARNRLLNHREHLQKLVQEHSTRETIRVGD